MCLENDPNFRQLSLRPWVYEFSNGRRFIQPVPVYGDSLFYLGITLDGLTFIGGSPDGTIVGTISVQVSSGNFTGVLSLVGMNASSFQIIGSQLATLGVLAPGSYSVTILATDPTGHVLNSPISAFFPITGTTVPFSALDIVTDHAFIQQQQPWHPLSMTMAGRPPQLGVNPNVSRQAMTRQEQPPPPPQPFFAVGGSPLFVVSPSIRRGAMVPQEDGRPWHPLPMAFAGNPPLLGIRPDVRRIVIVGQELPWTPNPSWALGGVRPFRGVSPDITDAINISQQYPWHPGPFTAASQQFVSPVPVQPGSRRIIIVGQEQPTYQPQWFGSGQVPVIGVSPGVSNFARTTQEMPAHFPPPRHPPLPHPGVPPAISGESPPGSDIPGTGSSINASPVPNWKPLTSSSPRMRCT